MPPQLSSSSFAKALPQFRTVMRLCSSHLIVLQAIIMSWKRVSCLRTGADQIISLQTAGMQFWCSCSGFKSHGVLISGLQELAWCTYSLVCNVNCSCVLIVDGDDTVVGVRGFFGQSGLLSRQSEDNLQLLTKVHNLPGCLWNTQQASSHQAHHPIKRMEGVAHIHPS